MRNFHSSEILIGLISECTLSTCQSITVYEDFVMLLGRRQTHRPRRPTNQLTYTDSRTGGMGSAVARVYVTMCELTTALPATFSQTKNSADKR